MGFFPEGAQMNHFNTSLEQVVAKLTPSAKQAMFSAATHGLIKRRTWNGCAFNAAGVEVGKDYISSTQLAAETFGMSPKDVQRFIQTWDALPGTDEQATWKLREAIEAVGLFTEPTVLKQAAYKVRSRVYTSYETKMREEFDASNAEAPIEGAAEAAKLLCGVC